MRSFTIWIMVASGVGGRVLLAPTPVITPAPSVASVERVKRDGPDAISLAEVLLTAVPEWIREVAATNIPQASSFISEEFQGEQRPEWFQALPTEIQSYLVAEFGPATVTALPTDPFPFPLPTQSAPQSASGPASGTNEPETSGPVQTSQTSESVSVATATTQSPDSTLSQSSQETSVASVPTESFSETISIPLAKHSSTISNPFASSTSTDAPSNDPGLSRSQKIGIGVGVPFAILGAAALGFGCCFLLRRRRKKTVNGSVPPSSPGFIPRFAFQEKSAEHLEQQHPLNRSSTNSWQDLHSMAWDDDVIEQMQNPVQDQTYMVETQNHQPIMAPALFHTHSSNRARGKRTSYTSLQSVAEVSEPDDAESPVLPRQSPSRPSLIIPPVPVAAQIKRKPVGSSPSSPSPSPAAHAASQTLMRQTMGEYHHNRSGSGDYSHPRRGSHTPISTSPYVSPIEERHPDDPFSNRHSYTEDYGPEYHHGYIDVENGLYGGHTSLSRYPEPKPARADWPLRNVTRHKRTKSPMWDRVYEE